MRIGISIGMVVAIACLAGCSNGRDPVAVQSMAPECSEAGQQKVDALVATFGGTSAKVKTFDQCFSKFDLPQFYGDLKGVSIDPFLMGGSLHQAERVLASRYDCEKPIEDAQMLPGDASWVRCVVGNVPVTVFLERKDRFQRHVVKDPALRRVTAHVYPHM
jgi:hypothetical protein